MAIKYEYAYGTGSYGVSPWKLRLWYEITQPTTTSTQISYGLEIYNTTTEAYNTWDNSAYYKLGQGSVSSLPKKYFKYDYRGQDPAWHTLGTQVLTITDSSVTSVTLSGAWHTIETYYTPGDITVTVTITQEEEDGLPVLKTACTTPTSITFKVGDTTPTIVTPSDKIEISWSGAGAGVNNAITGYDVYINCTSSGSVPATSETSTNIYRNVTNTSLTITTSDLTFTRGYKIRVKVRTKGDDENFYSGFKASSTLLVNQLPSAPTATSKSVLSSVTSTTISATAGAMNLGFSTPSVYWSGSATGTKKVYSTTTSFNTGDQGSSKTYYFWTYDGREFSSSYATAKITRNLAPQINSSSFTGDSCTINGFDTTFKNPVDTFSGSLTFNKEGLTCSITMKYGALTGSYINYAAFPNTVSNVSFGTLSGTEFSFSKIDPRTYVPFGSTFAIKIEAKDSVGESVSKEFLYFDDDTNSRLLTVADFPEALGFSNGVEGTIAEHFYDTVIFYYNYDSYFSDLKNCFNCSVSGAVPKVVSVTTSGSEKFIVTVNVGKNLKRGEQYTFINTISKKNRTSLAVSYKLIQCLELDGTTKNTIFLRPFTDGATGEKSFTVSLTNGTGLSEIDKFYSEYDIDSSADWCKTYIKYNKKSVLISGNFTFGSEISADYFNRTIKFSGSALYNLLNEFNLSKNTNYTMAIVNKITNKFGMVTNREASVLTVAYNEMPYGGFKISGAPAVKILYNDNLYDYPSGERIAEGLILAFVPTATTYNFENYTYTIQKSTNGTTWEDYAIEDNERSFSNQSGFNAPQSIPFTGNTNNLLKVKIGEISEDTNVYFRVGLKIGSYDMIYSEPTSAFQRQKHIATPLTINNITYDSGKLKFNYKYGSLGFISDNFSQTSNIGYNVSFKSAGTKIGTIFGNQTYTNWKAKENVVQNIESAFDMGSQTYGFISVKLTSVSIVNYNLGSVTYTLTVEKVYETEELTIYNAAQTISYRPNHIGINTSGFEENDVVRVNATATRYVMAFESSGGVSYLDLSTGELISKDVNYDPKKHPELSSYLNLFNGTFSGISIDCGEITS